MMTTLRALCSAMAALALTAIACGGGDPPGGGSNNGGTADGGGKVDGKTGNGGGFGSDPLETMGLHCAAGSGGPNPLIDVIPGTWTMEWVDDRTNSPQGRFVPEEPLRRIQVSRDSRDCMGLGWGGPPGDACLVIGCIRESDPQPTYCENLILDGEVVRAMRGADVERKEGCVLEDGRRIVVEYRHRDDPGESYPTNWEFFTSYRKLE